MNTVMLWVQTPPTWRTWNFIEPASFLFSKAAKLGKSFQMGWPPLSGTCGTVWNRLTFETFKTENFNVSEDFLMWSMPLKNFSLPQILKFESYPRGVRNMMTFQTACVRAKQTCAVIAGKYVSDSIDVQSSNMILMATCLTASFLKMFKDQIAWPVVHLAYNHTRLWSVWFYICNPA